MGWRRSRWWRGAGCLAELHADGASPSAGRPWSVPLGAHCQLVRPVDGFLRSLPPVYYPRRASGGVERLAGAAAGVSGAGSWGATPLAAGTSAGRALLVASAAVAIAIAAAAAVAAGGTTSSTNRSWIALVTPIVEGFIARNQPTWTRRPSTVTRRGALSQASRLSATRVTVPSEASRPAMRSGSSAAGSRERGHHPPSRAPPRASVGSRRSRSPGGADGSAAGAGGGGALVFGVILSGPPSGGDGNGPFGTTVASDQQVYLVAANRRRDACWVAGRACMRSGGLCGCRLGVGVGQRDGWVRRTRGRDPAAGRRVVAGLVGGAAEPVARGRAGPGPRASCRPAGAVLAGGGGQEQPGGPGGPPVPVILGGTPAGWRPGG